MADSNKLHDVAARYGGRFAIITVYVNTDEDFSKLGKRVRKAARGMKLNAARVQVQGYEAGWNLVAQAMAAEMSDPRAVPFDDADGTPGTITTTDIPGGSDGDR